VNLFGKFDFWSSRLFRISYFVPLIFLQFASAEPSIPDHAQKAWFCGLNIVRHYVAGFSGLALEDDWGKARASVNMQAAWR